MKNLIVFLCIFFVSTLNSMCQDKSQNDFSKFELEEFELINLCHCHEYLLLRDIDFIKWNSIESKENYLKQLEHIKIGQYLTKHLHSQYYQTKYDNSLFFKHGISTYFKSELDFRRLDSLYYEPIVQHYVEGQNETETLPYLGLGDRNSFLDCFYKIKEIPLEQELEYFLMANPRIPKLP